MQHVVDILRTASLLLLRNSLTHLWSIQSAPFFDQVLDEGEGIASWEFVNKESQTAYRWMAEQTTQRLGACSNGQPSVWAWHSCGAWKSAPTQDDFISLFGIEPQPHLQLQVATLEADEDAFLLSFYGPWCDMLATSPFDPTAQATKKLWVNGSVQNKRWRDQGNDRDIQATLLKIKREQFIDIKSTADTFGLW